MSNQNGQANATDLCQVAKQYVAWEQNQDYKSTVEKLIQNNDVTQLEKLVANRLTFGTAGIRGSMGPGYSQMNDLVIIQTSQGLASWLLSEDAAAATKRGILIGHDARHNSAKFARLAALAFVQKGIPVFFIEKIVPTPFVAFGVTHYDCVAGIVITASHNPKEDNGYKVYYANGAQILSPDDKQIQAKIVENLSPWPRAWDLASLNDGIDSSDAWDGKFKRVYDELVESYFSHLEQSIGGRRSCNYQSNLHITFTPMHGVGHKFLKRALEMAGFRHVFGVPEQMNPDPEFPTVKFPNPEEAGGLKLSFKRARETNSTVILANDPDADRCAAGVIDRESKEVALNGNQIGAILAWWAWHLNQESDNKKDPSQCYMLSTTVSSGIVETMSKKEGFNYIETLTGFKFMGNRTSELQKEGKVVLYAFEESIGYMTDPSVPDKDGISAGMQLAQCAAYLAVHEKRTLTEKLDWIYQQYGYHHCINSYYICRDQKKIAKMFEQLQASYPKNFGVEFPVKRIRDLNSCFDSGTPDQKPDLPCSKDSYMITFWIEDNIKITLRTSGTEPKIKYYSEIVSQCPKSQQADEPISVQVKEDAAAKLKKAISAVIEVCLKPKENGLESASDA